MNLLLNKISMRSMEKKKEKKLYPESFLALKLIKSGTFSTKYLYNPEQTKTT